MFHCAVRQEGVNALYHLEKYFPPEDVSFHYFHTFDELMTVSQRFALDLVVIAGKEEFSEEVGILQNIKRNVFMSIIPTALYHPDPDLRLRTVAYESGCDDFLSGDWEEKLFEVRLKALAERSRRDISVNPSSMLPGPSLIEREIDRQIALKQEFAVCYSDLDNFKAYNDAYGYYYGDKVIRLTARIIRDVVFDICPEGFVGHIGGDDFIYIIPSHLTPEISETILKVFDILIQYRYEPEHRRRRYLISTNRRGEVEKFDLLTMSIAVVINRDGMFSHAGEMSRMLADLKKYTKSLPGSNYVIERRTKY